MQLRRGSRQRRLEGDRAEATLPSYVCPFVVMMTSGAKYAGVPTLEPGADWNFSCCANNHMSVTKQLRETGLFGLCNSILTTTTPQKRTFE